MMNSNKKRRVEELLKSFAAEHKMLGKGPLSVALILTHRAKSMSPPFDPGSFLTENEGQVAGLSGSAVQSILADHGINRVLSEEGGRTSRGSISRMRAYIGVLNRLHDDGLLDLDVLESWWIKRVHQYFASQPLRIEADASKSLRSIIAELIQAAAERQKEYTGTMVVGAVMEHLVGAKLEAALPKVKIRHKGSSVADAPSKGKGDFEVHDTAIHVTTAPGEALIRKCGENLNANLRPLIITTAEDVDVAKRLAENAGISDRIDILDIEQFVTTNVYEWSTFKRDARRTSLDDLAKIYNRIIDECENDPGLKIAL